MNDCLEPHDPQHTMVPADGPMLHPLITYRLRTLFASLITTAQLTPRQIEVLRAFYPGRSAEQVADHLGVRPSTIRSQVSSILHKTGAPTIRDLILELLERAWLDDGPLVWRHPDR